MRQHLTNSGGRRFLMAIGAGVVASALQMGGYLDDKGENYRWIVLGTVAAYITGNTWEQNIATRTPTNKEP